MFSCDFSFAFKHFCLSCCFISLMTVYFPGVSFSLSPLTLPVLKTHGGKVTNDGHLMVYVDFEEISNPSHT